jgi:transmembrane sensor
VSTALAAIDPALVDQAAHWLARMHASDFSEHERAACDQWRHQSPEHERVWHSAEQLGRHFGLVPAAVGMPVLGRRRLHANRRALLGALAALAAVPPVLWMAYRATPWADTPITYRTATGERRRVALADGTEVDLNTATTIEVAFDDRQRLVHHRGGEILVGTAADPAPVHRPFIVRTDAGDLRALGTRFTVRSEGDGFVRLAVLQGAVEIQPARAAGDAVVLVRAGQQAQFTRDHASAPSPLDAGTGRWAQGTLFAREMPLGDFVAELARYRSGVLRCDPAVAQLRVSGAFQIDDTDRVLALLAKTLPVRIDTRTRYWVTVTAR